MKTKKIYNTKYGGHAKSPMRVNSISRRNVNRAGSKQGSNRTKKIGRNGKVKVVREGILYKPAEAAGKFYRRFTAPIFRLVDNTKELVGNIEDAGVNAASKATANVLENLGPGATELVGVVSKEAAKIGEKVTEDAVKPLENAAVQAAEDAAMIIPGVAIGAELIADATAVSSIATGALEAAEGVEKIAVLAGDVSENLSEEIKAEGDAEKAAAQNNNNASKTEPGEAEKAAAQNNNNASKTEPGEAEKAVALKNAQNLSSMTKNNNNVSKTEPVYTKNANNPRSMTKNTNNVSKMVPTSFETMPQAVPVTGGSSIKRDTTNDHLRIKKTHNSIKEFQSSNKPALLLQKGGDFTKRDTTNDHLRIKKTHDSIKEFQSSNKPLTKTYKPT